MKQKLFLSAIIFCYALIPATIQTISDQKFNELTAKVEQLAAQQNWILGRQQSLSNDIFSAKITKNSDLFSGMTTAIVIAVASAYIVALIARNQQKRDNTLWQIFKPYEIQETFSSIAGAAEAKEALQEIVQFLQDPAYYGRLGAKIPKGILLTGQPGTGKTLLARAVAGEANCTFISVSGSAFVQMYVGLGAARLRALFEEAASFAPCIIFIDEIDAVGAKRQTDSGSGGVQEHNHALNQLLACMDGFGSKDAKRPIIVIGATNHESMLDEALLRPGRFDRIVAVPLPSQQDRADMLKIHLRNITTSDEVDLDIIAKQTSGFSGADLQQLVNQATLIATKNNQELVTMQNFDDAINLIKLGAPAPYIKMSAREKRITAFHEAGHTLAHILQPDITSEFYSVTIVPRSRALGLASWFHEENKYSHNKEEMLAHICVALAGRAAEELMFGEIGTGAHNDFEKASDLAYDMVCRYGMTQLGTRIYDHNTISDATKKLIDQEVSKILDEQYARVLKLLKDNKKMLSKLAEALIKKETLYAPEIYKLLELKNPAVAME